jgi:hypothetical protein
LVWGCGVSVLEVVAGMLLGLVVKHTMRKRTLFLPWRH